MGQAWTWTYAGSGGEPMSGPALPRTDFPSQADAEAWLGDSWEEVAQEGVDAVTLCCDGVVVYGPMSLQPGD